MFPLGEEAAPKASQAVTAGAVPAGVIIVGLASVLPAMLELVPTEAVEGETESSVGALVPVAAIWIASPELAT